MKRKKKSSSAIKIFFVVLLAVFFLAWFYDFLKIRRNREENFSDFAEKIDDVPLQGENSVSAEKNEPVLEKKFLQLPESLEIPFCALKNKKSDHEFRQFSYYSICYRESYEEAEWSAYKLPRENLEKNSTRTDDFRADGEISTFSATPADYRGSGFDRGHLTPSADMTFSREAVSETFFMSNMTPQAPSFNRGIWLDLEKQVRKWAEKFGEVYVVSGPVLEKSAAEYESIGENCVSVPEFFYKVVLAPVFADENQRKNAEDVAAIGFIIPNEKCSGTFRDFAVSVDEVEAKTGIDFFYLLDDDAENRAERNFSEEFWK
jgi:endonuclease G